MVHSTFLFAIASSLLLAAIPYTASGAAIGERSTAIVERATLTSKPPKNDDPAWIKSVLARANMYRAKHGASALIWEDKLADYAQMGANRCKLKHTGGPYGENIYWISSSRIDIAKQTNASFDGWMREEEHYSPSSYMSSLHFTQHVWKASKKMGCAWSPVCNNSAGGHYMFCEYDPYGNVVGQFTKNVQE